MWQLLLALLALPALASAQIQTSANSTTVYVIESVSFDLEATVKDGPGLARDYVAIYDATGKRLQWKYLDNSVVLNKARTLKGGKVTFAAIPPGTYEIRFQRDGTTAQIGPGSTIELVPRLTVDYEADLPAVVNLGLRSVEIVRGGNREIVRVLDKTEVVKAEVVVNRQAVEKQP